MEKISVAVRVRPAISEESINGAFWKVEDNRISLHKSDGTPIPGVSYAFDHVLDQGCPNTRVYDLLIKDVIHAAVEGFNGTAFAYGQTSSGKTFTMNGSETNPGIIQRAVEDIFARIQLVHDREFLIRVSYMEIYNEEINDLFTIENQKLQIHESLERGVFVAGLREEIVNSAEQVLHLIQVGEANRHFGETNMNVRSSRSHTIFRMIIESKGKEINSEDSSRDESIRVSVLNLVDLAGSERVAKTGAGGVRLKEGKHINKSLMILGNVINRLSEGAKQRGHIPYRDSKLTRILQPALGGNAKTSIICTVAPEEIHIEETKGTLQFASRAKRITNCVHVNEILTDAALLKRQKLEIEELQRKLQGYHAGLLEQEILKLRNDLLKYEVEREKLAAELEEERRSQKEREQCIVEQQLKIDNLSSLVTLSETDKVSIKSYINQTIKEESCDNNGTFQEDGFSTPCFKACPNGFVVKRSIYSKQPEFSPLPDAFNNFVDEDTWTRMNKGYVADLESLQVTPAVKVLSSPSGDVTMDFTTEKSQELENLQRELKLVREERDELKKSFANQVSLNNQIMEELSDLQQETSFTHEIPERLSGSVANCKEIFMDVLSILQNFLPNERSTTAKLLSGTSEIGSFLFSTLESHFAMTTRGSSTTSQSSCAKQEQRNMLYEKLNNVVSCLVEADSSSIMTEEISGNQSCSSKTEACSLGTGIASWKKKLEQEVTTINEKHKNVEKELQISNQLLEVSKEKYHILEREFHLLKEERDKLLQDITDSRQRLAFVTNEKDKVFMDLTFQVQRSKKLEEEIKQFSMALASRHRLLLSVESEVKSIV